MEGEGPTSIDQPFALALTPKGAVARGMWRWVQPAVERATGLTELGLAYQRVRDAKSADEFLEAAVGELGVRWSANALDVARIPRSGPCIVVANHPFGAVEGIILTLMLRRVRPDAKVLANFLLQRLPALRDALVFVDPFGGKPRANVRSLRAALRHVKDGGLLAMFPAGEVAHFDWKSRAVVDPPWNETLAWLVRMSGSVVVPLHFDGCNGPLFQVAGLIHPRLRTALLPRELLNKRGCVIDVRVGAPIGKSKLAGIASDAELVAYLRRRTSMLGARPRCTAHSGSHSSPAPKRRPLLFLEPPPAAMAALVDPVDPD